MKRGILSKGFNFHDGVGNSEDPRKSRMFDPRTGGSIYTHIYTYTHIYIYIYTHIYTYIYIHTYTHTYAYRYISIHLCSYASIHLYIYREGGRGGEVSCCGNVQLHWNRKSAAFFLWPLHQTLCDAFAMHSAMHFEASQPQRARRLRRRAICRRLRRGPQNCPIYGKLKRNAKRNPKLFLGIPWIWLSHGRINFGGTEFAFPLS